MGVAAGRGPRTLPASPRRGQRLFSEGLRGPAVRVGRAPRSRVGAESARDEKGAPGGGSGAAAPLYHGANIQPLPPPPSPLPVPGSKSKDRDATVASGLPSSPNPLLAAQAEPPPPPSRPPCRIESSLSPREAPPLPQARASLPIGREKSRPGFQLAARAVRQKPPTARPRPSPCTFRTLSWFASPDRSMPAACRSGVVATRRPLALLGQLEVRRGVNPGGLGGVRWVQDCGVNRPPVNLNAFITSLQKRKSLQRHLAALKLQAVRGEKGLESWIRIVKVAFSLCCVQNLMQVDGLSPHP